MVCLQGGGGGRGGGGRKGLYRRLSQYILCIYMYMYTGKIIQVCKQIIITKRKHSYLLSDTKRGGQHETAVVAHSCCMIMYMD